MFRVITSIAHAETAKDAVSEAHSRLITQLADAPLVGLLVFASSRYDQNEVAKTIKDLIGDVPFVGASTAGEISNAGPAQANSIVLMGFVSDKIKCYAGMVSDANSDSETKGADLANILQSQSEADIKWITMHADGLKVNPSAILRGIKKTLPEVLITGGSAGDDGTFKETYQYCNGLVASNAVSALAFSGPIKVSIAVRHGWSPISGFHTVTKSEGSVVYEIDGKPAFDLYREYIGEEANQLKEEALGKVALSYPMGIVDEESHEMLLRAPFIAGADGSITFGGEVPEGSQVQLTIGTKEQAVAAAETAGHEAVNELGVKPSGALLYSCHVRNTLYASRDEAKLEIEAIQRSIGQNTPLAGFYTYAEQAPINGESVNLKTCNPVSHNETIVAVLIAEEA